MNKKRVSLIVFITGLVTLVAGASFLLFNIFKKPDIRDAEYLVNVGTWVEQDAESVIWQFTEIGKGTLTTNNHANDYDFLWAIDENTLKIETKWGYNLENEYVFVLDQHNDTLILTEGDKTITFIPAKQPTEQPTEAN